MQSYEQIAEDIRSVLMTEIDPTEDAMRELDERYADAVNDVNERLRECSSLLDDGLRTEAIQKCEAEPNLLDVVAMIDFPEFDVWADYCTQFGLPGPPKVFTEIAEQLNDAYNEEASLGDLLRRHRLHALLRSPLQTRLGVLRRLAHRDSGTPIWREDIAAYEKVRHNQLKSEIGEAFTRGDLPALAALEQEVRSSVWLRKPAESIVDIATKSHTTVRVKTARRQLEKLVDKLTDAYSAFDLDRGRQLRSRWHAQAAIALIRDDDPLLELAGPALDWLEQQDQQEQEKADHAAAVDAIKLALDDWAPRQDLERLYYKLQSSDREIDPNLVARMAERFAALSDMSRRRGRLIALGSVASILVVGGVIAWGIYSHSRASVLAQYVAALQQHVQSASIAEAEAFLTRLEASAPDAYVTAEIQKLAAETRRLREAEDGRKAQLAQLLSAASEAGTTWLGHGAAQGLLSDADDMITSDMERADVARVRREIESNYQQFQKEYDDKFAADFSRFSGRCDAVDTTDLDALKHLVEEGQLLTEQPRVSGVLLAQVRPLIQRLKAQRETELLSRDESQLVASIDAAVGNRREFRGAMENYIEAFPQTVRALTFKRVLENESKLWDGIEIWNDLIAKWEKRDFHSLTPEQATQSIAEAEVILGQHPGFPAVGTVQRIIEFLKPITQRVDEDGQSKHLMLNEPLSKSIPDLRMALVYQNSQFYRYYFSPVKRVQTVGDRYSILCYKDTGFEDTKSVSLASETIRNRRLTNGGPDWNAPQSKFSQDALDLLADFNVTKWDEQFFRLIGLLDATYDMAPQVRVQLLDLFLSIGCDGSQPMKQAYANHTSLIAATAIDDQPTWVDPEDVEGNKTRTSANGLLKRLGFKTLENREPINPHTDVGRQIKVLLDAMEKPELGDRYKWIGWLRKDDAGKWTVVFGSKTNDANLFVVRPNSDKQPQITKIGSVAGGELDLDRAPRVALTEGCPVYTVVR